MNKYYLYTPGDSSVGISGYDLILDEMLLEQTWREVLDINEDGRDFIHNVAIIELKEFAKSERGFFGPYKECPRHKMHIHPKFGCDVCADEHMGLTEPVKMRKGKFDDEDLR